MNEQRDESSFDKRLNDARSRNGLNEPDAVAGSEPPANSGAGLGARVGVELAAALAVGVTIGVELDRWLHTSPIFLLVFFFVGAAAGMMNVWRLVSPRKPPVDKED